MRLTLLRFHSPVSLTSLFEGKFCLGVIALLLAAVSAGAASIGVFDASSLGITSISGPIISGYTPYSFDFKLTGLSSAVSGPLVTGSSSFGYLNVIDTGTSQWLIHDEPIPLLNDVLNESNHFWFSPSGAPSISATYAILNDVPLGLSMPSVTGWSPVSGAAALTNFGAEDPQGQGAAVPAPQTPPPSAAVIEGYLRGGVPDLKQLKNECGPTSVTNSLLWLIKKYKLPTDDLPKKPDGSLDEQAILTGLAAAMNRQPSDPPVARWDPTNPTVNGDRGFPGLEDNQLLLGKKAYFADKGLPLVVHGGNADPNATGANAFSFVKRELKKGQDVEFLIAWKDKGSHWVTVTGYIDDGANKKTLIVHNPLPGLNGNQYWKLNDDGTFTNPVGTSLWAVAESPIPEPGTLLLLGTGLIGAAGFIRRKITG